MWLVLMALKRPVTILVAVMSIALSSILAIRQMKVDIFPKLGAPAIYVAQPYGGMDPSQMEGYLTYYYEYHFLYITGIEHVESKNIQGVALMKLVFHPETDMSQAMAEVVGYVNRSRAFMPPGAVPPFIMRYDAGSVPVAQLVFSSESRSPGEMQDIALNRVRPIFATLPGVSAPPPFGGNQRTIVVRVDPERMRAYRLSPEEVIAKINKATTVLPSGSVRTGDLLRFASTNAALGANIAELLDTPLRLGSGPTVYLRDIGTIADSTDVVVGYAHVDGKRTVYIPVTKRADASTLSVIQNVRQALPRMRNVAPEDVKIDLVFDQSGYVVSALKGLIQEGLLGACLTGLMVLLFLRDWRSALIVIITIPFALLSAVVSLWITGQTINIMTLGGLALAVGVLVDEATVEIENIHSHMSGGLSRARSVVDACRKTALPRFLAMLCVLSVFLPSLFMTGVGRQLFVPLSLAVGFAMVSSYLLSSTLVPVLSTWLIRPQHERQQGLFDKLQSSYRALLGFVLRFRWLLAGAYLVVTAAFIYLLFPRIGAEIFPAVEARQLQLRLRAPTGTRIERTEVMALKAMDVIKETVGPDNVQITTGFIGVQPPSYPINTIFLFTSGQHEAVLGVALKPAAPPVNEALKETLRQKLKSALPNVSVSFEAADIISRVMSFGSSTPIEVAVQGPEPARQSQLCRKTAWRVGEGFVLARSAVCPTSGLPNDARHHRSRSGRTVWTGDGRCGQVAGGRHLFEPFHGPQLLARPPERQCLPDSSRNPATQDGFDRRRSKSARHESRRGRHRCLPHRAGRCSQSGIRHRARRSRPLQHAARGQLHRQHSWHGLRTSGGRGQSRHRAGRRATPRRHRFHARTGSCV